MRKAWCTEIHTNFLKCLPLSFINCHGEKWLNRGNDVSDGINDILASKTVSSCDAPCMQEVTLRNICDSICEKGPFRGNQQCCVLHMIWKRSSSSLQRTLLRFASRFRFRGMLVQRGMTRLRFSRKQRRNIYFQWKPQYSAFCRVTYDVIANMASPAHAWLRCLRRLYLPGFTLSAHSILEWHQIPLEGLLGPV